MALIFKQTNEGKYFDGDLPFLKAFNQNANSDHKLDLSLYPEPFAGNADAKIYLLSGNPGWCEYDNPLMTSNQPVWDNMMQQSYDPIPSVGHTPTMYWLDPSWKKQIKPVNGYDGGFGWWDKRTNYLRNKVGIQDIHKEIFNIDYHPYHSKNIKINTNIQNLPSKVCVDNIIRNAFKDRSRLFIIVRCRKAWEERLKAILNVQQLPDNVIFLKNPRCAYLTPSNIICRRMIGKDCGMCLNNMCLLYIHSRKIKDMERSFEFIIKKKLDKPIYSCGLGDKMRDKIKLLQAWALAGVRSIDLPSVENDSIESDFALMQYCYYRLIYYVAERIWEVDPDDVHDLVVTLINSPMGCGVTEGDIISLCSVLMITRLRPYCSGNLFANWKADDVAGIICSNQYRRKDLLEAAINDRVKFLRNK